MSSGVSWPEDQPSTTYVDSKAITEHLSWLHTVFADLDEPILRPNELQEYVPGQTQQGSNPQHEHNQNEEAYRSVNPSRGPILQPTWQQDHQRTRVMAPSPFAFNEAARQCSQDPTLSGSPRTTANQCQNLPICHSERISSTSRMQCPTQQTVPNGFMYGFYLPDPSYNVSHVELSSDYDDLQPQLRAQVQSEATACSDLFASSPVVLLKGEGNHTTTRTMAPSVKTPARMNRRAKSSSSTSKTYTPTVRGSKETCIEPLCAKLYVPNHCRPGGRCPKCYDKHQKELAKITPTTFHYTGPASIENCRATLYPTLQPLMLDDDDVHLEKGHEEGYVRALLNALNHEYSGESADLGSQIDEGRYDAQKEFNQKPINQRERYDVGMVNKRMRILFHAAVTYHEGGESIYPAGGDNYSYGDVRDMVFTKRMEMITEAMKIDKCICMDVIEGRGVCGLVSNPGKYTKRKEDNYNSNMKKRGVLRELAEQKKRKGSAELNDELVAGAGAGVYRESSVHGGSAPPVPSMASGESSMLDLGIPRLRRSTAAVDVQDTVATTAGKRKRPCVENALREKRVTKRSMGSPSFLDFAFQKEEFG